MKRYVLNRFLQLIPLLIGLSILVFALLFISPGDPIQRQLTLRGVVSQELIDQEKQKMGLDKPFWEQYGDWLINIIQGDMGKSYKDSRPVAQKLAGALSYTALLSIVTLLFSLIIGIPIGIYGATKQDGLGDHLIRFFSFIGNSLPNFLLCVGLIYFFCIRQQWFPVVAKNSIQGLFLPTISLSIPLISRLIRQVRAEMLVQLKKDYITSVEIRGVKKIYILYNNALRNALPGILTVIGLSIGDLLGGSVVVENIFRWPGIGKLVMDSISDRDYPVIQGFVIVTAIMYVVINLVIDISYKYLDPRIER